MKQTPPLVSVVIVNFNGKKWLENCLPSLLKQSYRNLEVILVDNNSTDGSVAYVKKHFPAFKTISNTSNVGFAEGNNIGVARAKGEYYFLLNTDTVLSDKELIQKSVSHLQKNPKIGVMQPKICLLNNPDKIDLCGSYWTPTTMLYHYGCFQDEHDPMFDQNFPVFTCKGAAMFVRKECVDQVGLFDPDFWCYYEETDFCHRVWSTGFECWYFSEAKVLHYNGGTSLGFENDFIQFHNCKNKLRSFIKNFSGLERLSVVTKFTLSSVVLAFLSLSQGRPRNLAAIAAAYIWNIRRLIKKRKHGTVKGSIPQHVVRAPGIRYYIDLIKDLKQHNYHGDF